MGRYDGELALVTGGGSGIGEAMVELLVREGAQVVIADWDDASAAKVAAATGASAVHFDQADGNAWRELTAAHPFTLGIINAGVGLRFESLDDLTDDQVRALTDVNLHGVIFGTRELARTMEPRGGGRISVTASMASLVAHVQSPLYGASKWGVMGWIRAIAPMLQTRGITINGICPGLVDTPILGPGGGDMMRGMGMQLLTAAQVADAHDEALQSGLTGEAFTIQAARGFNRFEFAEVPGHQSGGPPPGTAGTPDTD
jgi:NAD(P)-dependent dehydrogenase (short-subunit alcohol dehydrogenase family)